MSVKKNMPIKEKVKEQQSHVLQGGNKIAEQDLTVAP